MYMKSIEWVLCFVEVKDVPHSKAGDIWVVLIINGQDKDRKRRWQLQLAWWWIEGNESHVECIQREVADELSLVLDDTSFSEIWEDKFSMMWYKTWEEILITVNLMYTSISHDDFLRIKSHTNDETLKIIVMELNEVMVLSEEWLRPGTLWHIKKLTWFRTQRAAS